MYTFEQTYPSLEKSRLRSLDICCLVAAGFLMLLSHCVPAAEPNLETRSNVEFLRHQQRDEHKQTAEPTVRLQEETSIDVSYPADEQPCVNVQSVTLSDKKNKRFQFALKPVTSGKHNALGRCLGQQGLAVLLKLVRHAVIKRGYITTRVMLPPQQLEGGALSLMIIPGRVQSVQVVNERGERVKRGNSLSIKPGDILNLRDIEQSLENLKRISSVDADIEIAATKLDDSSDVIIKLKERFPLSASFSVDDSGSDATGKYQGNLTLSCNNCLALSDLFYVGLSHDLGGGDSGDRGTQGYNVHYSLPFGYWTLRLDHNEYEYHQTIAGLTSNFEYSGDSQTTSVQIGRIVYRDSSRKTGLNFTLSHRRAKNFIEDTELEIQRRRTSNWAFGVNHQEHLGRGKLELDVSYKRGVGFDDTLQAPDEPFNKGASRPKIIKARSTLDVPWSLGGQPLHYRATISAQWNRSGVPPHEFFSIGNRYSVRGFDGDITLSAERGRFMQNTLTVPLGQSKQAIYAGIDYGEVGGQSTQLLPGSELTGGVLGLQGALGPVSYDFFIGQPLNKPSGFETETTTTGFNAYVSL